MTVYRLDALLLFAWGAGACLTFPGCAGSADPAACEVTDQQETEAPPEPFLAFAENFRGYHGWTHFDVTDDADLVGIHDGSTVLEYINRLPLSGSQEFPVGTMVVKEATGGTLEHELFAMAKRGGGYNPDAPGWEWFELQNLDDGCDGVRVIWRGVGPPAGETYGGDPDAGCNRCHTDCENDAVCAKPLNLSLL